MVTTYICSCSVSAPPPVCVTGVMQCVCSKERLVTQPAAVSCDICHVIILCLSVSLIDSLSLLMYVLTVS